MKKRIFTALTAVFAFVCMSANAQEVTNEMMIARAERAMQYLQGKSSFEEVKGRAYQRVVTTALAGVRASGGDVFLTQTVRLGYEYGGNIFETEGTLSRFSYSQENGSFLGSMFCINYGYMLFKQDNYHNYFSVNLSAGYASQKTYEDENLESYGSNWGFTGGAFVRYSHSLKKAHRLRFVVEGGYKFYPEKNLNGVQTNVSGVFANVGLSCAFF